MRQASTNLKLITIISILCLTGALLIAANTPSSGTYQISIYQAYPATFWLLLVIAIGLGLVSIFGEILLEKRSYRWWLPFLIVVLANTLILSTQYLQDYAFATQWDDVRHFGSVTSIIENQQPDINNFYPISHVLVTTFYLFTGLSLQKTIILFPTFFYLVYLANTAFAAWTVSTRPGVRGVMMALATPLVFGTFSTIFRPTHFSVYLLPFFIAWLYRTRLQKTGHVEKMIFVLLLLFLPFIHPWAVISALFILLLFWFAIAWKSRSEFKEKSDLYLTPLSITLICWLVWFIRFRAFGATIKDLFDSLVNSIARAESLPRYLEIADRASLPISKIISLIFYTYAHAFFYFAPAGIVVIWIMIQMIRRNRQLPTHMLALSCFMLIFANLALLSLFRNLIADSPMRILNIGLVIVPLLVSVPFYDYLLTHSRMKVKRAWLTIGMFVALFGASVLGMFSSFDSPRTGLPSRYYSYAQKAGVGFLLDKASHDEEKIYAPVGEARIFSAFFNIEELSELYKNSPRWQVQILPAHLGYRSDKLGVEFENPGYFWVSGYEKAYYTEVWPEGGRFTPQDFERLDRDPDWHQIYTSGDLTIWRKSHFDLNERRASNE